METARYMINNAKLKKHVVFNDHCRNRRVCLNEIRKNLASNLGRSLSNHSYGYAFSSDRPILFAKFPQIFVPSMKYPGSRNEL
jgi:isoleucyl-tRNA synthetase